MNGVTNHTFASPVFLERFDKVELPALWDNQLQHERHDALNGDCFRIHDVGWHRRQSVGLGGQSTGIKS